MKRLYGIITKVVHTITSPVTGLFLHNSQRVRMLVRYKDEVLLQRSSIGTQKWSVPGGGIEQNENAMTAAIRETVEEVGVVLTEDQVVCLGKQRRAARGGKWPMVDIVFYEVQLSTKQTPVITRPLEILEAKWFKLSDLPENHSDTLTAALELSSQSK